MVGQNAGDGKPDEPAPEGRGRYLGGWTYNLPADEGPSPLALPWELFKAMFREEWRLHKSFVGSVGSGFFPVVIFFFSLVLAATSPVILRNIDQPTILLGLHIAAILYGLGVGALARIGEQVMTRRLGQVNMLLQLPSLQPISFKTVMGVFFFKDAAYYILYSIIPLVGGIAAAMPMTRITPQGAATLFVTMLLTFMMGMALSFLLSALSIRSRAASGAGALVILILAAAAWPLRLISPGRLLLPLGFWEDHQPWQLFASLVVVLVLSAGAIMLMKERFAPPEKRYASRLVPLEATFAFSGDMRTLVAKEWIELRRSGALGAVFTGFLGPLLGIFAIIWIFSRGMGVPLDFNVVFYGGILGFLGLMTYSWLTNLEPNEFLNVQPVGVDRVIRAKLVLYFLLTTPVSFAYIALIGMLNGELSLVPLGALVGFSTMVYVAAVAGRMTGLRANTMLFDANVLGRFSAAIIPPLIAVTLISFWIEKSPLACWISLGLLSAGLLVASRSLFAGLGKRWGHEPFGI